MFVPVLLFALGLVLLIKGGDWFVDGATGIAYRFHVPELLIGATVVSIGTSLLVNIPVMFAVMLVLAVPALRKGRLARWQGIALLCIYAAFCVFQFAA